MKAAVAAVGLMVLVAFSASVAQDPPALSPSAQASLDAARGAFKAARWEEARARSLEVLAERGEDRDALYIAGASERQLNLLDDAERHLATLVAIAPGYPFAHHRLGNVRFLQGDALARERDFEGARAKYGAAAEAFARELERNPKLPTSASSRAVALARAGRFPESIEAHEAWIALAPDSNDPVVSLAATSALADEPTRAMAALDRLPEGNAAATSTALKTVANVFVGRSRWSDAIPFLERAAYVDPGSSAVRALLTEAYARDARFDDAAKSVAALVTMGPSPEEADAVGAAIAAAIGRGSDGDPGVVPPKLTRLPAPRYPEQEDGSVHTTLLILARVAASGEVTDAIVVPNRIWEDLRESGFEREAIASVREAKFRPGSKEGKPAALWTVVPVEFHP